LILLASRWLIGMAHGIWEVDMDGFACEPVPGGAEVKFRFDRERLAAFRALFPKAQWRRDSGIWFVPDPDAAGRVNLWIEEQRQQEREADAAAREAAESVTIEDPRVARVPEGWAVRTPYDPALVALLRGLSGARWDADTKRWLVPLRSTQALRDALPRLTELAAGAASRAAARARPGYRARSPLSR
jgi:hypothetical protein